MLTVQKHGNKIVVTNPANGSKTELINVVFVEEGRSGAIGSMSASSDFLSRITGSNTGLDNLRVHTHPIKADKIDLFPVGKQLPGHINRKLFSTPQISQQQGVQSRMVDGKPTYFTTSLDDVAKPDEDFRMDNSDLVKVNPDYFRNSRVGVAEVSVLERVLNSTEAAEQVAEEAEPAGSGNETLAS